MAKRLREDRGVTLLELMFACGIMAMALSLLFGSMVTISLANKVTEDRGIAVTRVASVMEEVRAAGPSVLGYIAPELAGAGVAAAMTVQCYNTAGEAIALPVDPDTLASPLPNPLQVECIAMWYDEKGHAFSLSASQWVYR